MTHYTGHTRPSHGTRPNFDELEPRSLLTIGFPGDGVLDITLIGDQYTNMAQWHADEQRISSYVLGIEPFRSRADQIQFHEIDNTQSLDAHRDPSMPRLLTVNYSEAMALVDASGIRTDFVGVIVNTPEYGGSGGGVFVSYNGDLAPEVFLHEFAHGFGSLVDQYSYGYAGPIDNQVHANAYAGTPPAAAWSQLVAPDEYFLGAGYDNWYRSSLTSIMSSVGGTQSNGFDAVSLGILSSKLDYWAAPSADHQAPQVSIVGLYNGESVSGVVHVATSATDDRAVTDTQLWVDGELARNDWIAPFTLDWLTGNEPTGWHTLQVKAFDASNNVGVSAPVSVDLTAGADMQIVSPAAGYQITGMTIPLKLSMWTGGADRFSATIDGTPEPISYDRQTGQGWISLSSSLRSGPHSLTVIASVASPDGAYLLQRYRASTTIQGSSSLVVDFRSPADGATLTGTVKLTAAVALGRPKLVEYFIDGNRIGTSKKPPFSLKWNSKKVRDGQHTLRLVAIDAAGVRWTSERVVRVKNVFDRKPPTVSLTSPRNNRKFPSGVIMITGKAKDDVGVTRVELLVDQRVVAVTSAPKFTFTTDVSSLAQGKHRIRVRAFDTVGRMGWSPTITINRV